MSRFKFKILSMAVVSFSTAVFIPKALIAADIFASPAGGGTGSSAASPATLALAIATVRSGDTLKLLNGNYILSSMVYLPLGVNLTSNAQDAAHVILKPGMNMGNNAPMLALASSSLSQPGNQFVSHITIKGTNSPHQAMQAIQVKNRNNVTIHDCIIQDFPVSTNLWDKTIDVLSSRINKTNCWAHYWPESVGVIGDDTTLDTGINDGTVPEKTTPVSIKYAWPTNPVENFEFYNNTVRNCYPLGLYNVKNSSVHHNDFDNSSSHKECMGSTCGFLNNVDIGHNRFIGKNVTDSTNWRVEFWVFRGGCKIHDNYSNGYYSISVGKQTEAYNNIVIKDPIDNGYQVAFEFNSNSYGEIYNNFTSGSGAAVFAGNNTESPKAFIIDQVDIYNNVFTKTQNYNIRINSAVNNVAGGMVKNIRILHNVIDGVMPDRGARGVALNIEAPSTMDTVTIRNNIIIRQTQILNGGKPGHTSGTPTNLTITHNHFFANLSNGWTGLTGTYNNNETADPLFFNPGVDYAGYALQTTPVRSPCIDSGVNVGLPYHGSAPDRGAIESGSAPAAPLAPRGLTVK